MAARHIPKPDFMDDAAWEMLMKTRSPEIIRLGSRAHVKTYLERGGEGDIFYTQGAPTLLLTTTGRKSGEDQVSPVNFMQHGDDLVVVGSIAGLERHPHWALNLDAKPEGWVQVRARRWPVNARKLVGEERQKLWPSLIEYFPLWGHFQKYSDREFFVFVLSAKPGA
jgi:deazaflavin-dependent oxidoreductase (nitroreductase family)